VRDCAFRRSVSSSGRVVGAVSCTPAENGKNARRLTDDKIVYSTLHSIKSVGSMHGACSKNREFMESASGSVRTQTFHLFVIVVCGKRCAEGQAFVRSARERRDWAAPHQRRLLLFFVFFLFFVIIPEGFLDLVLFFLLVFSRFSWAIFELLKFKIIQL
jgi:hypothetical protein